MLTTLLEAIAAMFGFAVKVVPDDKIREANQERTKQRKTEEELVKIYDREFRRLKNHTEINIATDVHFIDDNMADDQEQGLIELLTDRIAQYRKNHPILFAHWLKTQIK